MGTHLEYQERRHQFGSQAEWSLTVSSCGINDKTPQSSCDDVSARARTSTRGSMSPPSGLGESSSARTYPQTWNGRGAACSGEFGNCFSWANYRRPHRRAGRPENTSGPVILYRNDIMPHPDHSSLSDIRVPRPRYRNDQEDSGVGPGQGRTVTISFSIVHLCLFTQSRLEARIALFATHNHLQPPYVALHDT